MSEFTFRAKSGDECPVCGSGTKGCSAKADGLHFCRGVSGDAPDGWFDVLRGQEDDSGFRHFRRRDDSRGSAGRPRAKRSKASAKPAMKPLRDSDKGQIPSAANREWLAEQLGVPVEATHLLKFGVIDYGRGVCEIRFAEVDGKGNPRSVSVRTPTGEKKQVGGGNGRGLVTFEGWAERSGPVFVCEGMSDGLAASAARCAAVSRANAKHGADELIELFAGLPASREIVLLADGDEVGLDGAKAVAEKLAAALPNPVKVAVPPDGEKDARAYLTRPAWGKTPWEERGAALLAHVEATAEAVGRTGDAEERPAVGRPATAAAQIPTIFVSTDQHLTTAAAAAALAGEKDVFRRGTTLVLLVPNDEGVFTVRQMPKPVIQNRLTEIARIVKLTKDSKGKMVEEPVHPPKWLIDNMYERVVDYQGIRPLRAVVTHSLFLGDGSVLHEAGYHAGTGTLLLPNHNSE